VEAETDRVEVSAELGAAMSAVQREAELLSGRTPIKPG
jgi:hypothetical protein